MMNKFSKNKILLTIALGYICLAFYSMWEDYFDYKNRCLMSDEVAVSKSIDVFNNLGVKLHKVIEIDKSLSEAEAKKRLTMHLRFAPIWPFKPSFGKLFKNTKWIKVSTSAGDRAIVNYYCQNMLVTYYQIYQRDENNEFLDTHNVLDVEEVSEVAKKIISVFAGNGNYVVNKIEKVGQTQPDSYWDLTFDYINDNRPVKNDAVKMLIRVDGELLYFESTAYKN